MCIFFYIFHNFSLISTNCQRVSEWENFIRNRPQFTDNDKLHTMAHECFTEPLLLISRTFHVFFMIPFFVCWIVCRCRSVKIEYETKKCYRKLWHICYCYLCRRVWHRIMHSHVLRHCYRNATVSERFLNAIVVYQWRHICWLSLYEKLRTVQDSIWIFDSWQLLWCIDSDRTELFVSQLVKSAIICRFKTYLGDLITLKFTTCDKINR